MDLERLPHARHCKHVVSEHQYDEHYKESISATLGTALVLLLMALVLDCSSGAMALLLVALLGAAFSCEVAGAFTGASTFAAMHLWRDICGRTFAAECLRLNIRGLTSEI